MELPRYYDQLDLDWLSVSRYGWEITDGDNLYPYTLGYVKDLDINSCKLINFAGITVADKSYKSKIPIEESRSTIFLEQLPEQLINPTFGYHVAAMSALMQEVDFTHEQSIDFGAGSGLLSFIAMKNGLDQAVLIDSDRRLMSLAQESYQLNSFPYSSAHFITDRIECLDNKNYGKVLQNSTIAFANIGPQPAYGGQWGLQETVRAYIEAHGKHIRAAFLGGFGDTPSLRPEPILEKYAEMGFREEKRTWVQKKERTVQIAVLLTRG